MASTVEMASRAARKLADNLDEKKVFSSDCINFFARLECDIGACVKRAAFVGTESLSGIGNRPMSVTKIRWGIRYRDCKEGHASKKARAVPAQ